MHRVTSRTIAQFGTVTVEEIGKAEKMMKSDFYLQQNLAPSFCISLMNRKRYQTLLSRSKRATEAVDRLLDRRGKVEFGGERRREEVGARRL